MTAVSFRPAIGAALTLCFACWTFDFCQLIAPQFITTALQADLAVPLQSLGWLNGLVFAAAAVGAWVSGRLADRGRQRAALAFCLVVPAAGAILCAGAPGFTMFAVGRMITGFGAGGGWGIGHVVVQLMAGAAQRTRTAAILQCASPAGVVLAALLFGAGTTAFSWRAALVLSALPALLALAIPRAIPATLGPRTESTRVVPPVSRREIRASAVIFGLLLLQMTAYWCSFAWLPAHLREVTSLSPALIALTTALVGLSQAAANIIFGFVAARLGTRGTFCAASLLFSVGIGLLASSADRLVGEPLLLVGALAAAGFGCGMWAAFGPFFGEHILLARRARVASTSYNLARAGNLLNQPLVTHLRASTGGYAATFALAAAASAAAALLVWLLPARAAVDDVPAISSARPAGSTRS